MGRAASADDRRGELPGLSRRRNGPRDDAEVSRPGRALRCPADHRSSGARPAGDRARRRAQRVGRRHRAPRADRRCSRWAPSTKNSACRARTSSSGRGVSYCATCDAAFFRGAADADRGRRRLGDGGGDLPVEVRLARHDRAPPPGFQGLEDHARAGSRAGQHRAADSLHGPASSWPARTARSATPCCQRRDRRGARGARSGAFIAIGHEPQSALVRDQTRPRRERLRGNRREVHAYQAAGRLRSRRSRGRHYRQAVTAAGTGCQAALDAEWYLRDTPQVPTPPEMPEGDLAEAQWAPPGRRT